MFESATVHPSMAPKRRVPCAARSRNGTHRIGSFWEFVVFFSPPTRNQIYVGNVRTFFHTIFWPLLYYKRLPPALTGSRFFEYRLMPQGSNFLSFTWTFHKTSTLLTGSTDHRKGCQVGNGLGKKAMRRTGVCKMYGTTSSTLHQTYLESSWIWRPLSMQILPFNPTCTPISKAFRKLPCHVIYFHTSITEDPQTQTGLLPWAETKASASFEGHEARFKYIDTTSKSGW